MPSIKLEIRSNQPDKLVPVYLHVCAGEAHFRLKTEFLVKPEFWNAAKQELKPVYFDQMDFTIAQRNAVEQGLRDLKNCVEREIGLNNANGQTVSRESITELIRKFHSKESPNEETLTQYIKRHIREIENGDRLHDHNKYHVLKRYDEGSVRSYKGFQSQWNEFRKNRKLNFHDINLDLYYEFVKFFIKKDYSPNTIGKHIKHLKSILRAAKEEGLHTNTSFESKDFRVTRMPVQNIYLTEDEIRRLFDLQLDGFDEKVRDLFLIGCYTAQRFSDYKRIHPDMLGTLSNGSRSIELIQKKTGTKVVIPIRPELDFLLKKYNYNSPRASEQKVNDHIKEIARAAKITDRVAIEKTRGGLRKSETLLKCDLIMTHTARRSGCTNMFKAGIPTIEIMKISGHQTEKEFLKYILIDEEETAERLSVHPYFNQPVERLDEKPAGQKLPVEIHHLLDYSSN